MSNENLEDILEKKQKMQNMIIKEFNEKDKNKEMGNMFGKMVYIILDNLKMV